MIDAPPADRFHAELEQRIERWNAMFPPACLLSSGDWKELDSLEAEWEQARQGRNWPAFVHYLDTYEARLQGIVDRHASREDLSRVDRFPLPAELRGRNA